MNTIDTKKNPARQILIVDDEPDMRDLLKEVLALYQCVSIEASRATEAMAHIEKYRIDLILLDIHMQGASGLDLLKVMRRRHFKIPTIVISGYITEELAGELSQFGIMGILAKPFTPSRIVDEISKVFPIEKKAKPAES